MATQLLMPCPHVSDCFPCNDLPTTNHSAEGQDHIQDFVANWGDIRTNTPPLGKLFKANGCLFVCASSISQEDAFQCAQRQQFFCVVDNFHPQPPEPILCLNFPCTPTQPPHDPPIPTFPNQPEACTTHCADGVPFTFVVPAGSFIADNQTLANRIASTYACREALLHKVCLSLVSPFLCLNRDSVLTFVATGRTLTNANLWQITDGNLPPGMNFDPIFTGPVLSIAGIPTVPGDFTFKMRVTSPTGDFMEQPFTVTVSSITNDDPLPDAQAGQTYSVILVSSGIPGDVTWMIIDGELPDGLTLDMDTGEISGTTTDTGDFTFTVQAADEETSCEKEFHLKVAVACFIDALPNFAQVNDFSDDGFAVGQGNDGFPWYYRDHVEANINPPLKVYLIVGNGALMACGGGKFASGYEFDGTFSNLAGIALDESVPSIQKAIENSVDGVETQQTVMNAFGNVAWQGFTSGIETFAKFYQYAINAFTIDIRHPNLGTIGALGTFPSRINDSNSVLCDVQYGDDAPSFAKQLRANIWTAGVFVDIHPGTLVNDHSQSGYGWINASGHAVAMMVTLGSYRPFYYNGVSTSFLEGASVVVINRIGVNDSNVVVWDRFTGAGTGQVKMWDSINGVQTLPVNGQLSQSGAGGLTNMRVISNDGVIIGTRAVGGGWIFKDGVVHKIIDLLPVGHGWTSIDEGWAISKTGNFVMGRGVKGGVSQFFVAKLCI